MSGWEDFETSAVEFLRNKFGHLANFHLCGGSDSVCSDIEVSTKTNNQHFFIEVKKCPSQCGQFVLMTNIKDKRFHYSDLNSNEVNTFPAILSII